MKKKKETDGFDKLTFKSAAFSRGKNLHVLKKRKKNLRMENWILLTYEIEKKEKEKAIIEKLKPL